MPSSGDTGMKNKKIEYVFCVSTGRSGSDYLSRVLSYADNCVSVHEPKPRCNRGSMRKFLNGNSAAMHALMQEKVARIAEQKGVTPVYAESNHAFIKGFGWLLPEYLDPEKIAVVILTREKEKIVNSFHRIEVTCLTETGRNWLILPTRRKPLVPPPRRFLGVRMSYYLFCLLALPFRHKKYYKQLRVPRPKWLPEWIRNYEKDCLGWYVEETRALTRKFMESFPGIHYVSVSIDDLNDVDRVVALFEELGLQPSPALYEQVGVPTNLKG